ncbi:unnamed protein product [Didymodactylos carnosus]|uniref:Uncharacterized protein n=1 Tax=Didymodactylos carnosus TaxID=1234261 RepID=A0A815LQB2_9BILA|nr:unnamed protein product [Didymodactylos carnosus]CAF1411657.1 unnamed protein product [Didymodactylos carnosus]CAF4050499.1 unnamed protein product [Didymodactylos carnosus]CAF4299867.1 unnamed protein product [Didymodactylos carnosus]
MINYGMDTTVAVTKSLPSNLQEVKIQTIEIIYSKLDDNLTTVVPTGIILHQNHTKRTKYQIKNNSVDRRVEKFYVDHSADPTLGGYIITSAENCIKSVMGFSRFQLSLDPQEVVELIVTENATSSKSIDNLTDLEKFLEKQAIELQQLNVLDKSTMEIIKRIVKFEYVSIALDYMMNPTHITETLMHDWQTRKEFLSETLMNTIMTMLNVQHNITELNQQIQYMNEYIKSIFTNQERLRENIRSLEKVNTSDLLKRYLKDLNTEEDDLAQTRKQIKKMESEKNTLQKILKEKQCELINEAKEQRKKLRV